MGPLIATLAAPVAGPALYGLLHDRPRTVRRLDASIYVLVPALVAWQVLPSAWEQRSPLVLALVAAGLLVPTGLERVSRMLERHTDHLALVVGLSGLVLHALLEGGALAPASQPVAAPFALAVILHRVPVGLVIWWLIRPRYGSVLASTGVGLVILATLAGYGVGSGVLAQAHRGNVELYQAFVSGSLVHVVFHQGRHDHRHAHHLHHPH